MKNFTRVFFTIITFFIILFTARHYYIQYDMKKTVQSEEAREAIEEALKNRDPKAFTEEGIIKSYEIDLNSVKSNPLGGIDTHIIINNTEDLYVNYNLSRDYSNKLHVGSGSASSKLGQLTKHNYDKEK